MKSKLPRDIQEILLEIAPVWECEPPQRESYDSDNAYGEALIAYAYRVRRHRAARRPTPEKESP